MAKPTTPPPVEPPTPPVEEPATTADVTESATVTELIQAGVKPKLDISAELQKVEAERGGDWVPKTRLGRMVRSGQLSTMHAVLQSGLPLREPEIVDVLLPDLADDVTSVNMVQRMTDSGRRVRFSIQAVVGNRDGFVGLGMAKGKEVGPTIRKAIDNAKLNIIEVRRGCGSWQCGCGTPHTMPLTIVGKAASAEITIKPAPRGVGLAVGDIAKKVLGLAGVKDAWGFARGQTRTTVNAAQAAFNALERTNRTRYSEQQLARTKIVVGPVVGLTQRPGAAPGGGA